MVFKTTVDFFRDLQDFHTLLVSTNKEADSFWNLVDNPNHPDVSSEIRDEMARFMSILELDNTQDARMAAVTRLVSLRDDALVQVLKKYGKDEHSVEMIRDRAYEFVSRFYIERQDRFIQSLDRKGLLTSFYREVFKGMHQVGIQMTRWQPEWTGSIVRGVNVQLSERFGGDDEKVNQWLSENNLIDCGHGNEPGDRSYSVLLERNGQWKSTSYREYFPAHVVEVVSSIRNFKNSLSRYEDNVFHEKDAWLSYLESLEKAFEETDTAKLISRWADVDRCWMKIIGPIQPGHPLEYYEDHYRRAVALEWDVRVANPEHSTRGIRKEKIKDMAIAFYESLNLSSEAFRNTVDFATEKLDSVQLHIGRVGVFYGADFCGLPSAQVVPNDEIVSKECGKKIFAFPDNILQIQRSRPFVRLSSELYSQEFLKRSRKLLFNDRLLWFRLYDISTIGHEYGHVLWVDDDTEAKMSKKSNYKNVEEWKATTGGLMAFFMDSQDSSDDVLCEEVVIDLLKRSVGLIAWKETPEVLPYYVEGLIHLQGLFDSGVLDFDTKLHVNVTKGTYQALKQWYFRVYGDLVRDFYLPKREPTPFLQKFTVKEGKIFHPKDGRVRKMSDWYWDLYQKYGQEVDTLDHRSNYEPFDETK